MKSTPEMRARIRELMTNPQDDYDRAVEWVLDDLDELIATNARSSEQAGEWKQAAGVEAGLRREFLARAEAAEARLAKAIEVIREVAAFGNPDRQSVHQAIEFMKGLPDAVSSLSTEGGNG